MRFPDVHDPQSEAKTKQILSEIDRINQQLGYVKKQPRMPQLNRPPVESYFFPRDRRHYSPSSSWHQANQNLNEQHQQQQLSNLMQNYLIVPLPGQFFSPFQYEGREGRKFTDFSKMDYYQNMYSSPYSKVEDRKQFNLDSIEPPLITFPHDAPKNDYTISLPPTTTTTTTTTVKPKDKDPDLIDAIIDEVVDDDDEDTSEDEDEEDDDDEDEYQDDKKKKTGSETQNISINKYINNLYKNSLVVPKPQTPNKTTTVLSLLGPYSADHSAPIPSSTHFTSTTEKTRVFNPIKRIKDFNKRKKQEQQQLDKESIIISQEEHPNPDNSKSPFGFFRPAETALKEGGIVIQRLRVRQGGISIAGAGGVATSGSGGTSIVGPGGLALSHPRSLSVVGPGARVISIPANIDLGEIVAQLTRGRSLPFIEGAKVVATGPAIYYNTGMR